VLGFYGLLAFAELGIARAEDIDISSRTLRVHSRRARLPIELALPACSFLRSYLQQVGANGPLLPRLGTFSRRRFNAGFRRILMRAGIPARDVRFASLRLSAMVHLSNAPCSGNCHPGGACTRVFDITPFVAPQAGASDQFELPSRRYSVSARQPRCAVESQL
jgi:hypothetical protein